MSWHDVGSWGLLVLAICVVWFLVIMTMALRALVQLLGQAAQPFPWNAGHRAPSPRPEHHEQPEHIAAQRFARGDIDAETYHRTIEVLRAAH
jgi:putative membrane protein